MEIAVTGANGFIAKNFIYSFVGNKRFNINRITRTTSKDQTKKILNKCKILYHFAGVNRPDKKKKFKKDNFELTKFICDYLKEKKIKTQIIFSSSIQVNKNNAYGNSKRKCEKLLLDLKKKNGNNIFILRMPNIFGKWSRPNYNSVVATFCHNIARNKKVYISDPNSIINLLYVDDLVVKLKEYTKIRSDKKMIDCIKPNDKITLKQLYNKINSFQINRTKKIIGKISKGLNKNLYSTYISFLPPKKITYNIEKKNDSRGSFVEFYKNDDTGQVSFFIAKKGKIRGHHFHHSKVEKFLVVQGKAIFNMFDISTKKKLSFKLDDKNLKIVESIPGYQHYIKNVGNSDLIVLLWSNEIFDVKKPDTYKI